MSVPSKWLPPPFEPFVTSAFAAMSEPMLLPISISEASGTLKIMSLFAALPFSRFAPFIFDCALLLRFMLPSPTILIRHFEPSGTSKLKQSCVLPARRALYSSTVSVKTLSVGSLPVIKISADQLPTETVPLGVRPARLFEVCLIALNVASKSTALSELSE